MARITQFIVKLKERKDKKDKKRRHSDSESDDEDGGSSRKKSKKHKKHKKHKKSRKRSVGLLAAGQPSVALQSCREGCLSSADRQVPSL
jgi:hypothetical protein